MASNWYFAKCASCMEVKTFFVNDPIRTHWLRGLLGVYSREYRMLDLEKIRWMFNAKNMDCMGPRDGRDTELLNVGNFLLLSDMKFPVDLRNDVAIIAKTFDLSKFDNEKEFCFYIMNNYEWGAIYKYSEDSNTLRMAVGKFSDFFGEKDIIHVRI